MTKLRILWYLTSQDAVGYYRMSEPHRMVKKLKLADGFINPFFPDNSPLKDKKAEKERMRWYQFEPDKNKDPIVTNLLAHVLGDEKNSNFDAMIFQRADTMAMFSLAMMIRKIYNIPVIQEVDDYVFAVPGSNPAIRDYYDKPTEQKSDKEEPLMTARMSLGTFDGYIVSTPWLKEFYQNYSPTFICPNSIDLSRRIQKPKKQHDDFRIMFSSSSTHTVGLKFLVPIVEKFLKKYPDATFYQFRNLPHFIDSKQVKYMDWVLPDKYWSYINSLSPDVCLAPLADVLFNRAKSNLRLLEYWTSGKNAVIASPIEHYRNTIVDGKNGLLAKDPDEWFEKLEYLYKNRKAGEQLGNEGYKTVQKDYNLEKNAHLWTDAVSDIIKNYNPDREPPEQYQSPMQQSIQRF